jgi:hypothetical protein
MERQRHDRQCHRCRVARPFLIGGRPRGYQGALSRKFETVASCSASAARYGFSALSPTWTALAALWRQPSLCHANRARVRSSRVGPVFGKALSIERPGLGSACRTRARARRLRTNNRLSYGRRGTGAIRYVGFLGQRHLSLSDAVRGFEDSGIRALRPMSLVLATQRCSRLRSGRYRSLAGAGLTRIDACNIAGLT